MPVLLPPLVQLLPHPLFVERKLTVSVLRLDQLHPVISGNKWMKLQPYIIKAKNAGMRGLVTAGGPWSNHIHAAAFSAREEGMEFSALIRSRPGMTTPMLEDAKTWGANLVYVPQENDLEEMAASLASAHNYFFISMGGEGSDGITGVTNYFNQLDIPAVDYLICPVGTGTTLKGIAHSKVGYKALIGVNPGIRDDHYQVLLEELEKQFPDKNFHLFSNGQLKKFGRWPDWLPAKMNEWYTTWQLPTDIIYTAKMFAMFMDKTKTDFFPENSSILLVHTGGLQGNRSLPDKLLSF